MREERREKPHQSQHGPATLHNPQPALLLGKSQLIAAFRRYIRELCVYRVVLIVLSIF
jgi:hypothetical protein